MAAKKARPSFYVQHRVNIVVTSKIAAPTMADALEAGKTIGLDKLAVLKPGVDWLDGGVLLTGVFAE